MGEQLRGIEDQDILRRLMEFQRTQGALFGPFLGALTGQPIVSGPSVGSQAMQAGTMLGASALGAKP